MPITPDRHPGPIIEDEEIRLIANEAEPSQAGAMNYSTSGAFQMRDATGTFDPRTGGGGLTPATHRPLDQLVHEIAEDAYLEVTRDAGKTSAITYWTDAGKTKKIRETLITRDAGKVSQVVEKQYDGDGNLITGETITINVTRTEGKVSSMTLVRS